MSVYSDTSALNPLLPSMVHDALALLAEQCHAAPDVMIAFYMVRSDIDNDVHGPFATYDAALDFAELMDGSVLEFTVRSIDIKEVV